MGEVGTLIFFVAAGLLAMPILFGLGYAIVRLITWLVDVRWFSLVSLIVVLGVCAAFLFGQIVPAAFAIVFMFFGLGGVYGAGSSLVFGGRRIERR